MKNKKQKEEAIPFDGTMPAGTPISEKKPNTKKRKKVVIVCILLVMCILGAVGWYILYGNPNLLSQTFQDIRQHIVGMYGSQQSYIYYPIDYDLDITTVKGYMELDRDIHYKDGAYYSFTQQMIYDIEIEKLSVSESEKGILYAYNVAYKIYRNNGTFRNDIGSDGAKTLYFELLESNGSILIDRITYYT